MPSRWPFTGRDQELRAAVEAVRRHGRVVIAGAAGVGKSRLAREIVEHVGGGGDGYGFVAATATSRAIPLAPLARWTGTDAALDEDVTAVQQATRALRASGPRWVLGVDDAHLLDDVSATVLHQLAAERALPMVLTVRSGETPPDAVTALWKDGLAERIDLAPLSEAQTTSVIGSVLDGPIDAASEHRLHETTRGNVLWLRHLVDGEQATGRLTKDAGAWRWSGPAGLPPALQELIEERIGALTESQHHVLELVALGEPVGLDLLETLAGADAVEQVADRGLIMVESDGARRDVRVGHPLYGEAVRSRLSTPRARRVRGELSDALAATGGRRTGDGLRRAVLGLDSDARLGADELMRAAAQAVSLSDSDLGERLYRAACAAGGGFEARLGLAFLLSWLMRDEAAAELEAALASVTTDAELLRAALIRGQHTYFILEDVGGALRDLDAAQARVGTPEAATTLNGQRALFAVFAGDLQRGTRLAAEVLSTEGVEPWAQTWARWAAAYGRALAGRGEPVTELVRRGVTTARAQPDTAPLQLNIAFGEVLGVCLEGEPARAEPRTAWMREQPGSWGVGYAALLEAYAAYARGQPRSTIRAVGGVLPFLPGKSGGWTAFLHVLVAQSQGMLGEPVAGRAALELADRAVHAGVSAFDPYLGLGLAWVAAARGATDDARSQAGRAATLARSTGALALEVLARHTAVCFGDRSQGVPLAALARELAGPAAITAHAHAVALAAGDHAALMTVSDELADAGRLLVAADAAAQAAVIARDRGDLSEASTAAARATDLAARCEGARTPALLAAADPLPIKNREREIALLAAEGLTNRQIADRLHLSVRTVESHVYRACTRLGLADRAALIAAVRPGG